MEGPPGDKTKSPEITDRDFTFEIPDASAQEAYAKGDREKFGLWYEQEQNDAELDPSGYKKLLLDIKLARLKHGSGDHAGALEVLEGVPDGGGFDGVVYRAQQEILSLEASVGGDEAMERVRRERIEKLRNLQEFADLFAAEIRG